MERNVQHDITSWNGRQSQDFGGRTQLHTRTQGTLATGLEPGVRRHNGFLALGDTQIEVDDTNFLRWDVDKNTAALARTRVTAEATLRHTCCGVYPDSATYIGSGNNHDANIPCFNSNRYTTPQYAVNQSASVARIAIGAGLVVAECSTAKIGRVVDFNIYTQGQSSLMLGIVGWCYGSVGLNPSLVSGYTEITNMAPEWAYGIVPTMADNFIVNALSRGRCSLGLVEAAGDVWNFSERMLRCQGWQGHQSMIWTTSMCRSGMSMR